MTSVPVPVQVLLAALVVAAGGFDIRFCRIPNWLSLLGLAAGFTVNGILAGWGGIKLAAGGFALAFAIYFVLYLIHAMGAGDVKLMGAVGSLVGAGSWVPLFILTSLFGGIAALGLIVVRGRVRKTFWNVGFILGEFMRFRAPHMGREEVDVKSDKALRLPHGAVIALGSLLFLGLQRLL